MKGKLIVLDGGDGAGKATQTAMLVARLQADGREVETLDFPRYQDNVFGTLIRECLDGKRGDFMGIDARIASTLYAADRFETKPLLEEWLAAGKVVVLDRYVSANMLHQGAKIADEKELEYFLSWLEQVEYGIFGLPKPDAIVYLEVSAADRAAMKETALREGKHGGVADVAEADVAHQSAADRAAVQVSKLHHWQSIPCVADGALRTREEIAGDIYAAVQPLFSK